MFHYTNSLFIEIPFYGKICDIFQDLTGINGDYGLIVDYKDSSVYEYLNTGVGDPSANPQYKKSTIQIWEDSKITFERNLNDPLVQTFIKRDIEKNIQNDFQTLLQEIIVLKSKKGDVKTFLKTALDEIDYFHKEFGNCPWLKNKEFILTMIETIEDKIHSKFEINARSQNPSSNIIPLKWHGTIPKLCSIFYYLMEEHRPEKSHFFRAKREEIEEFIFQNFANDDGTTIDKGYITKIFNPNGNRIRKETKREIKQILQDSSDELPLDE